MTSLAHIVLNNSAASFLYFVVIENQILANLGLALTMVIVAVISYLAKGREVFREYFTPIKTNDSQAVPILGAADGSGL